MNTIVSPLETPDLARPIPGGLVRLGIVGHALWLCLRPTKRQAYFQSIKRQVEERGPVPDDVWRTPRRLAIARQIEAILGDVCWPERLAYHPNDPWLVIGEWEIGDLSELEALWKIGERFGFPVTTDFIRGDFAKRITEGLTFGELVSFVEEHGTKCDC